MLYDYKPTYLTLNNDEITYFYFQLLKILSGCFTYKRGDDNSIPRLCPPDLIPVFGRPTVLIPDLL